MGINTLLVQYAAGWAERVDDAAISASGRRRESLLGLGAYEDLDTVYTIADGVLNDFGHAREEVTLSIIPRDDDHRPYSAFDQYGVLNVPDSFGGALDEDIKSIGVTRDEKTGRAIYTVTVADRMLNDRATTSQALTKFSAGAFLGRSGAAQPVVPIALPKLPPATPLPTSPRFEYVDGGTTFGTGTTSVGSVTIGGDAPNTVYFLALLTDSLFNYTSIPANPSHPGASHYARQINGPIGFAAFLGLHVFVPGATPQTAAFSVPQGTPSGRRNYAWMLFKGHDVDLASLTSPTAPSQALTAVYAGSGGGAGSDFDTYTNESGHGAICVSYSFPTSATQVWARTSFDFGDDLAAHQQVSLQTDEDIVFLDGTFYPGLSNTERPLTDIAASVSESGTWSGSQVHGVISHVYLMRRKLG